MAEGHIELSKAYVQIVPSMDGAKGKITEAMGDEAAAAGESAGLSIASKIKGAIAAAGIGAAIKAAISEGADLEQSFQGGLDTLYEGAADSAREYAKEAAKAGISAGDYAEQAVSFGAALKGALGGDVVAAAEAANLAIMDMADNSAKMGTDIGAVQSAYQGFAKSNYTMLDNLKLGYGGTKTEMERLLADAQELSGVEYNIDNLADVYSAIHVIQEDLGLTGVAADEAATTISGSFGAMKAAAQNFLGYLVIGEDLTPALTELVESASTFLFDNLLPAVGNVISALPGVVGTFVTEILPDLAESGLEMLHSIADGMGNNVQTIVETITNIVADLVATIVEHLPDLIATGIQLIINLAMGLIQAIPNILEKIPEIIGATVDAFRSFDWGEVGRNIIDGIAEGIKNFAHNIASAAREAASNAINGVKDFLGIQSPSTVFRDQVGKMIDLGLAEGIKGNTNAVASAIDQLSSETFTKLDVAAMPAGNVINNSQSIAASGADQVNAIMQMAVQICDAINNKDFDMYIDGMSITRKLRPNLRQLDSYSGESLVIGG